MRGLKIIPLFLFLTVLSYVGVRFVLANPEVVRVRFGEFESGEMALGLIVLTSILIGMIISGALASVEMLTLYFQNRNLKRKLRTLEPSVRSQKALKEPKLSPAADLPTSST